MAEVERQQRPDRLVALLAAAAVQALIFYILLDGPDFRSVDRSRGAVKLLDLAEERPPPPPLEAAPAAIRSRAAPSPGAIPAPIPAPRPAIELDRPPTATSPTPVREPAASSGPGQGGSSGDQGSGGSGDGDGSNGIAIHAQRTKGALLDRDYPRSARRAGAEGIVFVRFTVGRDGKVGQCMVTQSSGHADLDATTCRLIERRFRYRPARDAAGRPVPEAIHVSYEWGLRR